MYVTLEIVLRAPGIRHADPRADLPAPLLDELRSVAEGDYPEPTRFTAEVYCGYAAREISRAAAGALLGHSQYWITTLRNALLKRGIAALHDIRDGKVRLKGSDRRLENRPRLDRHHE